MSDKENRKSMDDVLASIRRIVRAEKVPEDDLQPDLDPVPADERISKPAEPTGNSPLALTPEMMADEAGDALDDDEPLPDELDAIVDADIDVEEVEEAPIRLGPPDAAPSGAMPDDDHLKEIVRDVVLAELQGSGGADLVREIIRDELINGEIGGNITQNVILLIQQELAKE